MRLYINNLTLKTGRIYDMIYAAEKIRLQEEAYMNMKNAKITELPPKEILEERKGATYPQFEKHRYYSHTAERETPVNVLLLSASESDGVVGSNPMTYHKMLTENGTDHLWHLMKDTGHDASSMTPHLYNFLRLIFN